MCNLLGVMMKAYNYTIPNKEGKEFVLSWPIISKLLLSPAEPLLGAILLIFCENVRQNQHQICYSLLSGIHLFVWL